MAAAVKQKEKDCDEKKTGEVQEWQEHSGMK